MFKGIAVRLSSVALLIMMLALVPGSGPAALAAQADRETASSDPPPPMTATPAPATAGESSNPYYSSQIITLSDGRQVELTAINGPSEPPPGHEVERAPVAPSALNRPEAVLTLPVPAYDWVFGCSSVSASMIGAYFDRNGLPNIYTGPTNGGVMPDNNGVWPRWTDAKGEEYPGNPLAASRSGSDGRTIRGSIDDYWDYYDSTASDPYITGGWTQHTWGNAFGDYMKTSQSAFNNPDGATYFTWWLNGTPMTCAQMESGGYSGRDGTYGRKLFYEARGYTVSDCYNQVTDNQVSGGFSFASYKAQIDAGYPVLLNLKGHSIVGIGYDTSTSPGTVYINDTWDYSTHQMTWGGSYSDMALQSVSIVNPVLPTIPTPTISGLNPSFAAAGGPAFTLTVNGTNFISGSVVRWNGSNRTTQYVSSTRLTATINAADIATAGTASVTVLNPDPGGASKAVSFTIGTPKKVYLPLTCRGYPIPDAPVLNPIANSDGDGNYTVSWSASTHATSYTLQEDDNSAFSSPETRYSGSGTSWSATGKANGTYYYRVQASNTWGASGWSNAVWAVVQPPSGPTPGFWQHPQGGMEFYVTSDRAYVDDFAVYVRVSTCGDYKITHTVPVAISSNSFSFTGPFYASGTFSSQTAASGTMGLDHFNIDGCGTVDGGPWDWTASWMNSAVVVPATVEKTDRIAPASSGNGFKVTRIP